MTDDGIVKELKAVSIAIINVVNTDWFEWNSVGDDLVMKQHWLEGVIEYLENKNKETSK